MPGTGGYGKEAIHTLVQRERAAAWLEATRRARSAGFGNARTVRGLLELMEARMAERYLHGGAGGTPPSEYLPEDVPGPDAR